MKVSLNRGTGSLSRWISVQYKYNDRSNSGYDDKRSQKDLPVELEGGIRRQEFQIIAGEAQDMRQFLSDGYAGAGDKAGKLSLEQVESLKVLLANAIEYLAVHFHPSK